MSARNGEDRVEIEGPEASSLQARSRRHGGGLSLHSPPAGGAVFALRVPLDAAEEAEPPPAPDS